MDGRRPPIAWCGAPPKEEALDAFDIERIDGETAPSARCLACVFDLETCGMDALLHRLTPLDIPVLVRADADQVDEVLMELRSSDDVCLASAPASLLAHRIDALIHRSSRTHDALTGLPTRQALKKRLGMHSFEGEGALSLLLLDVDHLKRLNDEHGHSAGDALLRELAQRIRRSVGPDASVARVGGEEFAVVAKADRDGAAELAERIRASVARRPFDVADPRHAPNEIVATVSIGCATADQPGPQEELWRHADEAVYAAKRRGRNCAIHYDRLERESVEKSRPRELEYFEDVTRVITERVVEAITYRGRQLFEEIRTQADYDSLTGLYSRRYLDRRLPYEIERAAELEIPMTVALLDIDHFGQVNKEHGWPTGDRVLAQVADRIMRCVRSDDLVARYGGEEIVIVMGRTTLERARAVLERVRTEIADTPFTTTGGLAVTVTASIGAVELEHSEKLDALMERVSQRLLTAKNQGRNRVEA